MEAAAEQVLERSKKILSRKSKAELTVGDLSLVTEEARKAREDEARKELENILEGRTIGALGFSGVDPREGNQQTEGGTLKVAVSESQQLLCEMQRKKHEKREQVRQMEAAVFALNEEKAEQQRQIEETGRRTALRLAKERKERENREFELRQRQRDLEQFAVEMARTNAKVYDMPEPKNIETMQKIRQQIIEECRQGKLG